MQETVSLHAIAREPPCRAAPRLAQMPLSGITPGGDAVEGTSMQAEETVKENMVVAADEKRDRESTAAAAFDPVKPGCAKVERSASANPGARSGGA